MRGRALNPSFGEREARAVSRAVAGGDLVLFPADTVYGIACDPLDEVAVTRLYRLKRRPPEQPSAVMAPTVAALLDAVPELGPRVRAAIGALLPGPVGLLVDNPERRFPLACGDDPATLGLRVPDLPWWAGVDALVLQSSANRSGGPDAARLEDVVGPVRAGCDVVLDGGELPGTPSTMVDLRGLDAGASWRVVREGAVPVAAVAAALSAV